MNYNLATSTPCGPSGNLPCDPRGLGISPTVSSLGTLPAGNDTSVGDGLNYIGFRSTVSTPLQDDFGVFRLDHNFTPNWRFSGSFTTFRELNMTFQST